MSGNHPFKVIPARPDLLSPTETDIDGPITLIV
jgi:hypothetical protein